MKKKLYFNTIISFLYQIISIIIGLILPRLFLISYGSKVNGLVQSITQLLSIISLMDLGIGAVVQAALYKPLAKKDYEEISILYSSAKKYFNLIAKILLLYVFCLSLYYALFKTSDFDWIFSTTLILSISISSFAQYYFGICNTILLNADQKIYIPTLVNLLSIIINAIFTIILINLNFSIQIVKLVSSLIFIIRPLLLTFYVNRHYSIKIIKNPPKNAIKNQWSGLTQHVATVLTASSGNVILTFFSTFQSISIYNIYILPLNAIRTFMDTISSSYKSFFGTIIAKEEKDILNSEFDKYETTIHFTTVVIFGAISIVLVPFVLIYTNGVNDANYENQIFALFITLSYAIYSLRLPYTTLIFAAGKFKETQIYCLIECIINIVLSILLVNILDLVGVALATCISVGYRLFISAFYLKKDIIHRKISIFLKHILVDCICFVMILFIPTFFEIHYSNFFIWFVNSFIVFCICLLLSVLIYFIFYKNEICAFIKNKKSQYIKKGN